MKPLSLTLTGFIGIRSGLNRETITLDLENRHGLVALVGENGMGKTTVLDSLHPYRLMPFRANGYTERSFSYYEETYGDARKELIWSHEGVKYRSDVRIKGGGKVKKTEATLYIESADGWLPARAPDGTASDGKTDTYDTCVHAICGTPEMFFTAAFSKQKRKPLSDYTAGDMKLLLSELLGLDSYLERSKQAMDAAKHVAAAAEGFTAQLQQLDADTALLATREAEVLAGQTKLEGLEVSRSAARQLVGDKTTAVAQAKAAESQMDAHRARRAMLAQDRIDAETRASARRVELGQSKVVAEKAAAASDLVATVAAAQRRLTAAEALVERATAAAAFGSTKDEAAAKVGAATTRLAETVATEAEVRAHHEKVQSAVSEWRVLSEKRRAKGEDGVALKATLAATEKRAGLLSTVPCAGMDIAANCDLLKEARKSGAEAAELITKIATMRTDYEKLSTEMQALEALTIQSNSATASLQSAIAGLTEARAALDTAKREMERATEADQARSRLDEAKATIAEETEAIATLNARIAECRTQSDEALIVIQQQLTTLERETTERLQHIASALAATPDPGNTNALADAQRALQVAEADFAEWERMHAAAQSALARLNAETAVLHARVEAGAEVRQKAIAAADDLGQWRLLSRALGKDGIVALAIDDAGPTISGIANELLAACYGPRFSVRFDTQSANADGTLREDFDIRVFDAERNDDKSLAKTSGGEQIWLNEAITRAISLHKAAATGQAYECYFSDESDGALHDTSKAMFMKMKRRVMELGGADTEYYITHTPALWEMATSIIDFNALRAA